jgi:biopolymer transport protein ExbD
MVSTNFNDNESRIDLQVPKVSGANALVAAPESRVVNVGKDGSITLDQKVLSLAELVSKLRAAKQQYADTTVIVRADVESSFRRVAEVFGACNDAGVRISLSVRPGSVVR